MPLNLNTLRTSVSSLGMNPDLIAEFLLKTVDEYQAILATKGDADWKLATLRDEMALGQVRLLASFLQSNYSEVTHNRILPYNEVRDN